MSANADNPLVWVMGFLYLMAAVVAVLVIVAVAAVGLVALAARNSVRLWRRRGFGQHRLENAA